jgi:PAS domain S-box-containing protein
VLSQMLWVLVFFGCPVVAYSAVPDIIVGRYFTASTYVLPYTLLVASLAIRSIAYKWRASCVILAIFVVGTSEVASFGIDTIGTIYLYAYVLFACALLGMAAGLWAIAISVATLILLAITEVIRGPEGLLIEPTVFGVPEGWVPPILSHLLLSVVSVNFLASLLYGLDRSVLSAQRHSSDLRNEMAVRRRSENALRQGEERFRGMFEGSRDAFMTLGPPNWHFQSANPAMVRMLRVNGEEDIVSKAPWELSPEFQADGTPSTVHGRAMIERALETGGHFFEWTHKRLDGEEFPTTVMLTKLEIGGETLLQATVRDITESKKAEEALRESERKFRSVFESSRDALALIGDEGIIDCNEATLNVFGCERKEELFGLFPADLSPATQADGRSSRIAAEAYLSATLRGPLERFEWLHCRLDGSEFTAEVLLSPMRLDGKSVVQTVIRDVTERKQAEADRARLATALAQVAEAVILTDADGVIEYVNPAFEIITGYPREEAIGQTPRLLKSGAHDDAFYRKMWETISGGAVWDGNIVNRKKTGRYSRKRPPFPPSEMRTRTSSVTWR